MFARLKVGAAPKNGRARRVYVQVVESKRHRQNANHVSQRVISTLGRVDRLSPEGQRRVQAALSAALADVEPCKPTEFKSADRRCRPREG